MTEGIFAAIMIVVIFTGLIIILNAIMDMYLSRLRNKKYDERKRFMDAQERIVHLSRLRKKKYDEWKRHMDAKDDIEKDWTK